MKLGELGHAIGTRIDSISRAMSWVSSVAVLLVFLLVFVDVIGRYFFNRPIPGSNDIGELLLIPVAFFAMGFTQLMKTHVRVTLIYERFSQKGKAVIDFVMFFLGAAVWGLVAWNLGGRALELTINPSVGSSSLILGIPHLPFLYLATVGSLLFFLQLLADSVRALTERKRTGSG